MLPRGPSSHLSNLTDGFVADYKRTRVRAEGSFARNTRQDGARPSPATINRDLVALGSFLNWCEDTKELPVQRPKVRREREPQGRERWLSPNKVRAIEAACPVQWWPLFATLLHTGMRIGEAQGLVWADARLPERRIAIHEGSRRVKTASSVRDVPVSEPLAAILDEHAARVFHEPKDPVSRPRSTTTRRHAVHGARSVSTLDSTTAGQNLHRTPPFTISATLSEWRRRKLACQLCDYRSSWAIRHPT